MSKRIISFLVIFFFFSKLNAQIFTQADPFYLLEQEKNSFTIDKYNFKNFLLRPFLNQTKQIPHYLALGLSVLEPNYFSMTMHLI
ncbi:MAG: hypothetical protein GWP19_14285 [Planctomycetia bacterium]|nr:hypothetical protein [Planctomycetia bacterium]